MNTKTILFIGGAAHGKWIKIPLDYMTIMLPAGGQPQTYEPLRLVRTHPQTGIDLIYKLDSLSDERATELAGPHLRAES